MTRVVVTGATGNVGWSVVRALAADERVDAVVGIARRLPDLAVDKTSFIRADIAEERLDEHLQGADCVVHLAWALQPDHDLAHLERVNVHGSANVFDAVARTGVPSLVYASSVGAYSPGAKNRLVDETWPTDGVAASTYSDQKARVERLLDEFEARHPDVRVVRLRKALVFQREAATEIARLFLGRLAPLASPLGGGRVPVVPRLPGLAFQVVHSDDVGDAYRRAVLDDSAHGAYNVAAEPVLDAERLGEVLGARPVPAPPRSVVRAGMSLAWRTRLLAAEPGWLDLALEAPTMASHRIRGELGWRHTRSSPEVLRELLDGFVDHADGPTPPLRAVP